MIIGAGSLPGEKCRLPGEKWDLQGKYAVTHPFSEGKTAKLSTFSEENHSQRLLSSQRIQRSIPAFRVESVVSSPKTRLDFDWRMDRCSVVFRGETVGLSTFSIGEISSNDFLPSKECSY
jgi:hypothetical protein